MNTYDVAVIGAGVIGMSIAWELTEHGCGVVLLDGPRGRNSASWAAAGMLPPMGCGARDPLDRLQGLSHVLYPDWVARLQHVSDTDLEFWPCGSVHVAAAAGEAAALLASAAQWEEDGVRCERLEPVELAVREPSLAEAVHQGAIRVAYYLPEERQIQPRLVLSALRKSLERHQVPVVQVPQPLALDVDRQDRWQIQIGDQALYADHVCLAAGAYTGELLRRWGISIDLEPRRGQIIQFSPSEVCLSMTVDQGPLYLVPRRDGRILVGSTVEDVGFDDTTRPEDLQRLCEFAQGLVHRLADVSVESGWAGLRPRMGHGYPAVCPIPGRSTAWLATGHFRNGIQLAPATAVLMRQLILQQPPIVDPGPFQLSPGTPCGARPPGG